MSTPNLNNPIVDKFGILQQAWYLWFQGLFRGTLGAPHPLPTVPTTTPSNALAAAQGVAIGQMYTANNDPAIVYIRTA